MLGTGGKCFTLEFSIPHCFRVINSVPKSNELYIYATLSKKLRDVYSICQSINLSIYICLSICLPIYHLFFYQSQLLTVSLFTTPSICLSVYPPLYLSVCLSTYLSTYLSFYLSFFYNSL
jgi:hypothetical protein